MDSIRQEKVNALLLRDISEIIREEGSAILPGVMISVTEVRVSPDLGYAKVFVSFFPTNDKLEAIETFQKRSGEVRFKLGKKIGKQVRVIPELNFILDDSIDRANRIDELLKP